MNQLVNKLSKLVKAQAVSGYEWTLEIVPTIQDLMESPGQRIGDNLVYKLGSGKKKIYISAHMDEVGFMITKSTSTGCKVMPIGSINIESVTGKKLIFNTTKNGMKIKSSPVKKSEGYSQLLLKFPSQTDYVVKVGDVGTFEKKIEIEKQTIRSPSLDNKVGCLALIEGYQLLKNKNVKNKSVYFCFASREEQSANGLMSAVKTIDPDICIDIDSAYAQPIKNEEFRQNWLIPELGKGPALQLLGKNFILRSTDRSLVEDIARKEQIPLQYEIPDGESGGTNARTLINAGYETIQINIPVAYQHTAKSKASLIDINNCAKLLTKIIIRT